MSFSDFKLVLDNRVYRNIDGRWADLFNKLKWDTIKSVVKSVTGLQGRKFKVLQDCYTGLPFRGIFMASLVLKRSDFIFSHEEN